MRASAPKQTDDFIKLAGPLDNANFFWLYNMVKITGELQL